MFRTRRNPEKVGFFLLQVVHRVPEQVFQAVNDENTTTTKATVKGVMVSAEP